ncbi:MAG: multidrug DMT transporter permease [Planctomycetota bacterium]|jgi:glucose uptake protein
MVIIETYSLAVVMCFVTMLCWGSWANTQKLATKEWKFQLFYWDYSIGVLLLTVILALTMGSFGTGGRGFLEDLGQAGAKYLGSAFLGGIIFNVANILLVAAIDIAGLAVAFPIGIGLALVIGVISTYYVDSTGNAPVLFAGVAAVAVAIILDSIAYKRLPSQGRKTTLKGFVLSILCGILMGFFYRYVAAAMPSDLANLALQSEAGKLTPYTALVVFAFGLFLSNFVFNTIVMAKPFVGEPVRYSDYFRKGNPKLHLVGIIGGAIWGVGMSFSILAGDSAGYAVSYGLGQGATMVAAFWGVFIWKEFKAAPAGTNKLLMVMFIFYILGLALIIMANT